MTDAELSEAFKLGGVLARVEERILGVAKTADRIDTTVTGMSERLGVVENTLGQQDVRLAAVEARPTVTREELNEIRTEMRASRLTWPKLLAGAGAVVGTLVALNLLNPPPVG